jgi:N-acetylglutamate synthase-like GNAT family acetyltransferase
LNPKYQGQGIARMLFEKAEARARSLEFKQLVGVSVQSTESFWTKMGFIMKRPYSYNGSAGTFMVKELV